MNDFPQTIPDLPRCTPRGDSDLVPLLVVAGIFIVVYFARRGFERNGRGKVLRQQRRSRLAVPALLFIAAAAIVLFTWSRNRNFQVSGPEAPLSDPMVLPAEGVPKLVFLGAGRCRPCQAMAPGRETLRSEYAGGLVVEYYDVWKDPEPGHRFGIRTIPTTIFVGPDGRELLRREGYMSQEDIVNQWSELGFALKKGTTHSEDN